MPTLPSSRPGGARLLASLLLFVSFVCFVVNLPAADRITATVAVTNAAGTTNGQTIQIIAGNNTTRTWTNAVYTIATEVLTNNTPTGAATNLYNHLLATPPTGIAPILMTTSTNVVLYGQSGIDVTVTLSAGWGTVSYSTQTVTSAYTVRVPNTVEAAAQRTNIASAVTAYLNLDANTNQIAQSAAWAAQLLGTTNTQTLAAAKAFTNATGEWRGLVSNSPAISGNINNLTNGTIRDTAATGIFSTNTTLLGTTTFRSGAEADVQIEVNSAGILFWDNSAGEYIFTLTNAQVGMPSGGITMFGVTGANGKTLVSDGSGFLNLDYLTTMTNGTLSGSVFTRTNTFPAESDVAFGRYANSSLANGNNAAVLVGTNVFVEVSGPTAAFTLNGLNGSPNRDGKFLILLNRTGYDMTIAHDSGVDPTAANRIYSNTGADRATTGNGAATLIYSASAARWILLSLDP